MAEAKRPVPHPEWVQMYRNGIRTAAIAAAAGVGKSTVRYHLRIAAQTDPSIRADHHAATTAPSTRVTAAGLQNMKETIALSKAKADSRPASPPLQRNAPWPSGSSEDDKTTTTAPSPPSIGKA